MKFFRNVRIYHGRFDAAAYLSFFFSLLMFLLFGTLLVSLPGVRVWQPESPLPNLPRMAVAVDATGQIQFENQPVSPEGFRERLAWATNRFAKKPSLLILTEGAADSAKLQLLLEIANEAGIAWIYWTVRGVPFAADPGIEP